MVPLEGTPNSLSAKNAGRAHTTGKIGCPGTQHCSRGPVSPPCSEFNDGPSLGCPDNTVGLRGNQRLMIDGQKNEGFKDLGFNGRRSHRQDRFIGENGRSFRYRIDVPGELKNPPNSPDIPG